MRLPCIPPFVALGSLALLLLGCPSDDVTSGEPSGSHGSEGGTTSSTSGVSATGMLPPAPSSTSTSDGADSGSGTTVAEPTGTTSGDDIGPPPDDPVCSNCCGNGTIQGTEQCDCGLDACTPEGLGFAECARLQNPVHPDRVYTGGIIDCSPASCQFIFTGCTFCGDGMINGNETCEPKPHPQESCASLGLGDAVEPLPCDETCQIDTSSCR